MDAIAYRSGKGMGVQLGSALVTVNEALYVCTWFLTAFFLLAAGSLAFAAGRRALGRSAIAIAAIQLVTTAASVDNLGQMSFFLWLVWIVYASVTLGLGRRARATSPAIAQAHRTPRFVSHYGEPHPRAARRRGRSERSQPLSGGLIEPFAKSRGCLHQPVDEHPVEHEQARRLGRRDGGRAGAPEACSPVDRRQLAEELARAERRAAARRRP